VFLHELSHAVDYSLPDRKDDYAYGEVVAELSAAFLGSLYGIDIHIPSTKAYIDNWAGKNNHAAFKLIDAVKRVEAIFSYVEAHRDKRKRKKVEHDGILLKPKRARRKTVFDFG
jgi:antirestriction protein ArdC